MYIFGKVDVSEKSPSSCCRKQASDGRFFIFFFQRFFSPPMKPAGCILCTKEGRKSILHA